MAVYLADFLRRAGLAGVEQLGLMTANFPVFDERLRYLPDPPAKAVVIVSPEYNPSAPASTRNAVDLLTGVWVNEPVGIVAVSAGSFGARGMWGELSKILLAVGARPSNSGYFVPAAQNFHSDSGLIATDTKPLDDRRINSSPAS